MTRRPRIVVPGLPHHVTQRGNRRQPTFFERSDYELYIRILGDEAARFGVQFWAWCLMPNHTHLIAVPQNESALPMTMAESHRRYSSFINDRHGWTGHLWQGRYYSCVMDEQYTLRAIRYVELNPVAAGLAERPQDYWWSSARAHILGERDPLAVTPLLLSAIGDWAAFLGTHLTDDERAEVELHERTGRPLGDDEFVTALEARLGRQLRPGRAGRPRRPT